MNPLSSDFDPTVMIFGANDSGGLSLGYNGNSISVHSQTEFQTCHKMPKQNFQVLERGKDIRFHSVLIFLELVCVWEVHFPDARLRFCPFFFSRKLLLKFDFSVNFKPHVGSVHCLRTHKFYFSTIFSLKIGLTVLFTHLKIILLQFFLVFSFSAVFKRILSLEELTYI